MASEKDQLVNAVARATKVDRESVAAVLEHLGLGRILGEAKRSGKVSASNLRVAIRLGKNTIAV